MNFLRRCYSARRSNDCVAALPSNEPVDSDLPVVLSFDFLMLNAIVVPFVRSRYRVRYMASLHVDLQFLVEMDELHSAYFTSRPILYPSALVLA